MHDCVLRFALRLAAKGGETEGESGRLRDCRMSEPGVNAGPRTASRKRGINVPHAEDPTILDSTQHPFSWQCGRLPAFRQAATDSSAQIYDQGPTAHSRNPHGRTTMTRKRLAGKELAEQRRRTFHSICNLTQFNAVFGNSSQMPAISRRFTKTTANSRKFQHDRRNRRRRRASHFANWTYIARYGPSSGMVQTQVTTPSPNSVGNALRGVPADPERHGVRSLQDNRRIVTRNVGELNHARLPCSAAGWPGSRVLPNFT